MSVLIYLQTNKLTKSHKSVRFFSISFRYVYIQVIMFYISIFVTFCMLWHQILFLTHSKCFLKIFSRWGTTTNRNSFNFCLAVSFVTSDRLDSGELQSNDVNVRESYPRHAKYLVTKCKSTVFSNDKLQSMKFFTILMSFSFCSWIMCRK